MGSEQPSQMPNMPAFRQPLDPRVLAPVVSAFEGETLQVPECDVPVYHGQGRIVFKSGFSYTGEFELGRMHGQGRMQWDSGVVYEGDFVHNEMQGRGQYSWPNGSSYIGDIVRGKRQGHGVFRTGHRGIASLGVTDSSASLNADEESAEDGGAGPREAALEPLLFTYHADLSLGGESLDAQSNARYEGMWLNGLPHGHGELIYDEVANIRYEGEFVCGKRSGRGQMHYASGSVYQGDWVNDVKCGHGVMTWMQRANSDNNKDMRSQQTEQLVPREQYDGEWLNDCQHGHGRHLWWSSSNKKQREKNWYEGAFANGVRHGFGVFYYVNGARYEGEWEDNVKQGNGIFFYDDGRVLVSRFEHDRAVAPLPASPMTSPVKEVGGGNSVTEAKEAVAPVTAGARLVLYIDELLPNSEATRDYARKAIEHAAMRLNTELRALYRQYAKEPANGSSSTGSHADVEPASAVLVMELFECRRLLADCGVVDISGKQLETFLQQIRSAQRESAMARAAVAGHLTEELHVMLLSNPCSHSRVGSSNSEIIPYDQLILYREFVELLIRIVIWRQTLLKVLREDENSERSVMPMGSIAESFSALIDQMTQTRRELAQLKEPLIPSLYTQLYARDLRMLLRKHDAALRNLFADCGPTPLKGDEDPAEDNVAQVDSVSVRALLAMLRSSGCVFTPDFRVRDALIALQRTPLPAQPYPSSAAASLGEFDPSAFDMTLVYSDFQEAIATILYAKQQSTKATDSGAASPSLCVLVDQFIASQTATI